MSDINKRIKKIRLKKFGNRSKSKLCMLLNVPDTTYQGYEKDTEVPANFLKLFCDITNINANWLLTGKGSIEKPLEKPKDYDTEALEKGEGNRETPQPYTTLNANWEKLLKSLSYKQWIWAGRPERRKAREPRSRERRKVPYKYLEN